MSDEMYKMDAEDHDRINEAAEWFLGTLKPRTSSEVRGVLVRLYLHGMARGVRLSNELLEETLKELK